MFHVKQKINVLSLFTLLHSTKLTFLHIMRLQKPKEKKKKKLSCVPYYFRSQWKFTDLQFYFTELCLEWDFD